MIVYTVKIYKNINDNTIFFIPEGINKHGIRISINKPEVLKEPYDIALIGATLRKCLDITVNGRYTDEDMKGLVKSIVTGEKSEKKIVKNHLFQIVFFNKEIGYKFEANMRSKDGRGYKAKHNISLISLEDSADDSELGKAVLQTFDACN